MAKAKKKSVEKEEYLYLQDEELDKYFEENIKEEDKNNEETKDVHIEETNTKNITYDTSKYNTPPILSNPNRPICPVCGRVLLKEGCCQQRMKKYRCLGCKYSYVV